MPDVADAAAHHQDTAHAAIVGAADRRGDGQPVLQNEDNQQQHHQQTDNLRQREISALRQSKQKRRFGKKVSVNRDIGNPTDPQHDIVRRLIAYSDDAQIRRAGHEKHARNRHHGACNDAGVYQRDRHQPRYLRRFEQRHDHIRGSGKGGDRQYIDNGTGQKERQAHKDGIALPAFDRRPGPRQQSAQSPFGDEAGRQNRQDLPEDAKPDFAVLWNGRLAFNPVNNARGVEKERRTADKLLADAVYLVRHRLHDAPAEPVRRLCCLPLVDGGSRTERFQPQNQLFPRRGILEGLHEIVYIGGFQACLFQRCPLFPGLFLCNRLFLGFALRLLRLQHGGPLSLYRRRGYRGDKTERQQDRTEESRKNAHDDRKLLRVAQNLLFLRGRCHMVWRMIRPCRARPLANAAHLPMLSKNGENNDAG